MSPTAVAVLLAAPSVVGIAGILVWFYNRHLADLRESLLKKAIALGALPLAVIAGTALGIASARHAPGHPIHVVQAAVLVIAAVTLRQAWRQFRIDRRTEALATTTPLPPPADPIDRAALAPVESLLLRVVAPVNQPGALRLRAFTLAFPHLPEAFDGYRIVHLTDLHRHRFLSRAYLDHVVAMANAARGDLVLFGGDAITRAPYIAGIGELLAPLHAPDGVYAVRGNHDYWTRPGAVAAELRAAGIRVLANEVARLARRDAAIALIGLEWPYLPLTRRMMEALDADCGDSFRLALVHTPAAFPRAARLGAAFAIAGHTHGGQVRLPFFGTTLSSQPLGPGYSLGLHHWGPMRTLVSAGAGAFFPLRVGCPPELLVITLRRGGAPFP